MIFSTDKSITITGLKHGSTQSFHIFRDHVNELAGEDIIHTRDQVSEFLQVSEFKKKFIDFASEVLTDRQVISYFDGSISHSEFGKYINPFVDLFRFSIGEITKPVYIFVRNPKQSIKSAIIEDVEVVLRRHHSSIFDQPISMLISSGKVAPSLILSLAIHHQEEILKVGHSSTFFLTDVLFFCNILEHLRIPLRDNVRLVDLDMLKVTNESNKILQLEEDKVILPPGMAHRLSIKTHRYNVQVLDSLISHFIDNVPMVHSRNTVENTAYSILQTKYIDLQFFDRRKIPMTKLQNKKAEKIKP